MSDIDKSKNIVTYIAITSFIFTVVMGELYRPWIYRDKINDFGIADSAVSFGGAIVAVFFFSIFMKENNKNWKSVLSIGFGCILYEFLQPYLGLGVFDTTDILGIILGTFLSLIVILKIWKKYPKKQM